MNKKSYISDLLGLDLLRFILSVIVMITHYYFFYYRVGSDSIAQVTEPFYGTIGIVYKWGVTVVQIFWIISGVIFQMIYYNQLATRKVDFKEFILLRLTRLYPLHLLTLLVVAVCQVFYFRTYHTYFWYQTEDLKHFFLQLFFMGSWTPFFHHSFNVPVWSVSIELFVYIVFFLISSAGLLRGKGLYIVFAGCLLLDAFNILNPFGPCLVLFLSGCILARFISEGENLYKLFMKYVVVLIIIGSFTIAMRIFYREMPQEEFQLMLDTLLIPAGACIILVAILMFRNVKNGTVTKTFKSLGDLTYSTYLIHFPIQLIIVLIIRPTDTKPFDNPAMLFFFIGIATVVGWLISAYFEKPVQRFLRSKLFKKSTELAAAPMIPAPQRQEETTVDIHASGMQGQV